MEVYSGNPRNKSLGTKDESGRVKGRIQRKTPLFLPLFFALTPKGKYRSEIVSGGELDNLYGEEMLQTRNKFNNHVAFFLQGAIRAGSTAMVRRLPFKQTDEQLIENNGVISDGKSTVTIWATVNVSPISGVELDRDPVTSEAYKTGLLLKTVPGGATKDILYVRLSASSEMVQTNVNGLATETVPSAELTPKFFADGFGPGQDAVSYPLFTFSAPAHGEAYNNYGIWIDALVKNSTDTDMIDNGLFPFVMGVYDKTNGKPKRQNSSYGDSALKFTLAEHRNHPKYNYPISITDTTDKFNKEVAIDSYAIDTWFDDVVVHQSSINTLTSILTNREQEYIDSAIDPDYAVTQDIIENDSNTISTIINLFTMRSSKGVHYEVVRPANEIAGSINPVISDTVGREIYMGISNPVYMRDGSDGDLSCEYLEQATIDAMEEYTDIDSMVINTATNKESVWVDSGHSLEVKLAAAKLLTHRRDISLIASTYETPICSNQVFLTSATNKPIHQTETEALAVETLVKNVYSLYPESVEYNTSTSRAAVVVGYGKHVEDSYPGFIPLTYDFMIKNCKLAGGFDGKMDRNSYYNSRGQNIVTELKDLYPKEITYTLSKQLWSRGAIWLVPNDRREMIYSSNQTIYPDDTSILNRYVIQIVICALVKLNDEAWRYFTGTDDMSNEQLKIAVEDYINRRVGNDKFIDSIIISPNVYFTKQDLLNGFSWHLEVSISSNVAKTVMISNLKSLRIEN